MWARLHSGAQPLEAEREHGTEQAPMASPEGGRHWCWWSGVLARSGLPRAAWQTSGRSAAWLHASGASGQSTASAASGACYGAPSGIKATYQSAWHVRTSPRMANVRTSSRMAARERSERAEPRERSEREYYRTRVRACIPRAYARGYPFKFRAGGAYIV